MNVIKEFMWGGNSNVAKIGRITGLLTKSLIKWSAIGLLVLTGAIIAQSMQYSASINDVRNAHLKAWSKNNIARSEQVISYRENCFNIKRPVDTSLPIKPSVSIYLCASEQGSVELSNELKIADDLLLVTPPLSWFGYSNI